MDREPIKLKIAPLPLLRGPGIGVIYFIGGSMEEIKKKRAPTPGRYAKYKKSYDAYRNKNKERLKELSKDWKKKNKDRHSYSSKTNINKIRFGLSMTTQEILQIIGCNCSVCGLSEESHILRYNRSLSIHHRDGKGRSADIKNNSIDNLVPLCLSCHAKEHRLGAKK